MVLTRSGRDVQRRLSRSAGRSSREAAEASPQLSKKKKSAPSTKGETEVQKNKHESASPPAKMSWLKRTLLYPLTPFTVIWTLSGIFMMCTGQVYPETNPLFGTRGRWFQYVRRAFGILLLIAAGVAYTTVQYQKMQRPARSRQDLGAARAYDK